MSMPCRGDPPENINLFGDGAAAHPDNAHYSTAGIGLWTGDLGVQPRVQAEDFLFCGQRAG
eukprot:15485508-Alexandrium_andersonii.AAC.1